MRRYSSANLIIQTFFLTTALWLAACTGGNSGAGNGDPYNEDAGGLDSGPGSGGGTGNPDPGGLDIPGADAGTDPLDCDGGACVEVDAGPYCGNGIIDQSLIDPSKVEVCDDGNAKGGDGCSGTCLLVEPNFRCDTPGQPCVNTVVCGNGIKDTGEGCDDGNTNPGDGCNTVCSIEAGFTCPTPGSPCIPLQNCGDSRISTGEGCDDGARVDGDGCSANCTIEPGYRCRFNGTISLCTPVSVCGDGNKSDSEECDDGGTVDGDCCSSTCRLEGNFCSCPEGGGPCTDVSACGNGVLEKVELCDDANLNPGDGCDAGCNIEEGFQCRMAGQPCVVLCGDGIVKGNEKCDDGGTANGDGCSSVCLTEPGWDCASGTCVASDCGNGQVETGESCDAGEDLNGLFLGDGKAPNHGSGCSKTCTWEPACRDAAGTTGRCSTVCGDGNWEEGFEDCDDGNLVDNDGCSSACTVEPGFRCAPIERADVEACSAGRGDCLILPITFRDFDGANAAGGHPDFFFLGEDGVECVPNASGVPTEQFNVDVVDDPNGCWSSDATDLCSGLVATTLGPNGKPTVGAGDLKCACRFTDWDETGIVTEDNGEQCWNGASAPYFIETDVKVIDSAASFAQWYTDVPSVNQTVVQLLELASSGGNQYTFTSSDGETVYDDIHEAFEDGGGDLDSGFFPLDDQTGVGSAKLCNLWPYWVLSSTAACRTGGDVSTQWDPQANNGAGSKVENIDGVKHNFYFTSEVRYLFKFEGGEELSFFGDDDVWVFINGKLVLDLGAPHERLRGMVTINATGASANYEIQAMDIATNRSIDVDDGTVTGLGMEVGGTYEIVVFHADRHPRESNYELTLSGFSTNVADCGPDCGDGVRAGIEECDNGAENADGVYNGCTTECRFGPFCGDGVTNGDEQCDDGRNTTVASGVGGCAPGCVLPPSCGDGFVSPGEDCDDGAGNVEAVYSATQTCNTLCQVNPYCGDGIQDAGEECDDGLNIGGYGFCAAGCILGPRCGDGEVQNTPEIDGSAEQCDDGNLIDDDDCTNTCGVPGWCGDGLVQAALGEQCDLGTTEAGNDGSYGGCNPDCTPAPYCGDSALQEDMGEECDYGPLNDPPGTANYGGCLNNCRLGPHCGDGDAQGAEECDDGNSSNNDGCSNACQVGAY